MPMNKPVFLAALGGLALLTIAAWTFESGRQAGAALIGAFAGLALYHARFGFTGGWRRLVRERRGAGLRAQLLLIGLTCVVSYPLIAWGSQIEWQMFGESWSLAARGNVLPMTVASALGAFVFGVGMQLGGGCASGTLFTAGGGSTRMMLVLVFFIAGSVWATYHWDFWAGTGRVFANTSVIREFGALGGLAALLALLGALWLVSLRLERRAHGGVERIGGEDGWLQGPWSLRSGAIALALVGILCFLVLGRPWGVTYGFAVWGAQAVDLLGGRPTEWTYWSGWRQGHVEGGLLASATSVMNIGIVAGAMGAAALAGKWSPIWALSRRDLLTAVIGGLMMGYGARLAYGCNIGAYLGGLVSGSLHGVWWLVWGFAGSALGVWLRARLAMDPPLRLQPQGAH
ncbi:MAG: YeeE/YedE family protein [Pseudomonadota bacterium]